MVFYVVSLISAALYVLFEALMWFIAYKDKFISLGLMIVAISPIGYLVGLLV